MVGSISQNTSSNPNFKLELSGRKDESGFPWLQKAVCDIKNIILFWSRFGGQSAVKLIYAWINLRCWELSMKQIDLFCE